ncbi:MFS transporter [Exiguobacterium sp. NPDC077395]|uniref:MFS transporter n=1 Tax=Exiguobacterium sp. NPDC077395 TaxID=3390563 RepID=UPI003D037C19
MNIIQVSKTEHLTYSPKTILLICLALAFAVMNGTMFNIALPDIAEAFALSTTQVSWMVTGFITVFALGTLIYGRLADIFPIRTLYTTGIALLSLGGLIGFLAISYEMLIIGRIVQAMGAAAIPSLSFIIPVRYFPKYRGQVFGYLAATIAFASGIGPIVGGVVGGVLSWRFIFLISVVSALAIPIFRKSLPVGSRRPRQIDYIGALLVGLFVTCLLFALTKFAFIPLVMAGVTLSLLVWRIKVVPDPFINPEMLKNPFYSRILMTSFFGTFIISGLLFTMPLLLRELYRSSTMEIGFIMFPGALVAGVLGKFIGKSITNKGGERFTLFGLCLITFGTFILAYVVGSSVWVVTTALFIAYLGFPLIQSATADLISQCLNEQESGTGLGLFNLSNFFAGAFSSAFLAKMIEMNGLFSFDLLPSASANSTFNSLYFILGVIGLITTVCFFRLNNMKQTKL